MVNCPCKLSLISAFHGHWFAKQFNVLQRRFLYERLVVFHLDAMDVWFFCLAVFSAHLAYGRNACSLLQFASMLDETCGSDHSFHS